MERLDKVFANKEWISLFPKTTVIHLPKTHSDHNPLLIEIILKISCSANKPFRLESFWYRHPQFTNLVNDSWDNTSYTEASSKFLSNIKEWKTKNFGDIYRKKKNILARLEGIQNYANYTTSPFLKQLENTLQIDYNNILRIEDDFWKLRARISWIQDGDASTRFFHIMASNRHRRNRITYFKDNTGNCINGPNTILLHTTNYFKSMFTTNHSMSSWISIKTTIKFSKR